MKLNSCWLTKNVQQKFFGCVKNDSTTVLHLDLSWICMQTIIMFGVRYKICRVSENKNLKKVRTTVCAIL